MKVRFHGAAGEVTGSCHEVFIGRHRLLLDCGMIQGTAADERRNRLPFDFHVPSLDAVVLSHGHIDHCGRLPMLIQQGFKGPIWTHRATADLLRVMLEDAATLAEADAERNRRRRGRGRPIDEEPEPLFTHADVARTLQHVHGLDYDEPREILPGVWLTLRDAGHILGSATVELRDMHGGEERRLVFSGDIGPLRTPILRDWTPVPKADLVLLESTYGGRAHRERGATVSELGGIFEQAWREGGNVLVPAFSVGRSQELLYWLAKHFDEWNLGRWTIYLDSPMAAKVLAVYDRHTDLFDEEAQRVWSGRTHPFRLPNLKLTPDVTQSQAINAHRKGAIIIAGSGMCNGGRIRHHLRHHLGRTESHIVFVGYQGRGTLGRRLVDGEPNVRIFGEWYPVKLQRHTIGGLSAHADQPGLMAWYGAIAGHPPVVLVHGEDEARESLRAALSTRYGCDVRLAAQDMERDVVAFSG